MSRLLSSGVRALAILSALSLGCGGCAPFADGIEAPRALEIPPIVTAPPSPGPELPSQSAFATLDTTLAGDSVRLALPQAGLEPGRRYPLLLFHHGHGMDERQLTERTHLAARASREGWLAASAAFGGRAHWGNPQALAMTGALISHLVERYQGDPSRIYLIGFSMGGGTALLAAANPLGLSYRVAAVASSQGYSDLWAMTRPEAGGGAYARPITQAYGGSLTLAQAEASSPLMLAERLRGIPVYLEHGEQDTSVPASHSVRMAGRLKSLGIAHEFHLHALKGHGEGTIDEEAIIRFFRGKKAP